MSIGFWFDLVLPDNPHNNKQTLLRSLPTPPLMLTRFDLPANFVLSR